MPRPEDFSAGNDDHAPMNPEYTWGDYKRMSAIPRMRAHDREIEEETET
jgi:hypothetical protein